MNDEQHIKKLSETIIVPPKEKHFFKCYAVVIRIEKFNKLDFRGKLFWIFWGCDIFLQGVPVLKLFLILNLLMCLLFSRAKADIIDMGIGAVGGAVVTSALSSKSCPACNCESVKKEYDGAIALCGEERKGSEACAEIKKHIFARNECVKSIPIVDYIHSVLGFKKASIHHLDIGEYCIRVYFNSNEASAK